MAENWATVPNHPNHIVSDIGRIRHRRVGAPILTGYVDLDGYRRVRLDGKQCRVHRLVCEAFNGPPPPATECAHSDGDPLNNRADNLRWATRSENRADAKRHGTLWMPETPQGSAHHSAKLTEKIVAEARRRNRLGESGRVLAKEFGVTSANMSKALRGDTWAKVTK